MVDLWWRPYAIFSGPSTYPPSLQVNKRERSLLSFVWQQLECADQNGPIIGYECRLYVDSHFSKRLYVGDAANTSITIPDLSSCTSYSLSVAAVNEGGTGDHSPLLETSTMRKSARQF